MGGAFKIGLFYEHYCNFKNTRQCMDRRRADHQAALFLTNQSYSSDRPYRQIKNAQFEKVLATIPPPLQYLSCIKLPSLSIIDPQIAAFLWTLLYEHIQCLLFLTNIEYFFFLELFATVKTI